MTRHTLYKRPIDGRVVWIHALGHVVKDASGKPTDMYGVIQDITAFKQLETDLRLAMQKSDDATKAKSAFLANMSHEIRTPMNGIIGLSHLALKTPLNPKQRDYLSKVHNRRHVAAQHHQRHPRFLQDRGRQARHRDHRFPARRGDQHGHHAPAQQAHDKGLEFLSTSRPRFPSAPGRPARLGQILINLVGNAIKFTEQRRDPA